VAFQTIGGENSTDYIGTDNVDALFVLNDNSGKILVDAKGGNDVVDLTNESGVVGNTEVKLGEGADVLTMGANDTGNNRLSASTVNGGPGNDNITTEGALSTKIRGNEQDDDFFLLSNYTDTTINGNSGVDSFTIGVSAQNRGGTITLSDTKILGGSNNDGQMDFSDGTILAVDSVIQGGKGLDTITIGDLANGLSNFRVSGGADNDTIVVNNTNGNADGAQYNGAAGEDTFTFANTNAGNAVSKGGDAGDRYTISGTGSITAEGEAGNDVFAINGGQNAGVNRANARNIIIGGEGADTYSHSNLNSRRGQTYRVNSVSESAAAVTGTAVTFDTFSNTLSTNKASDGDILDLDTGGTGEELVGNRLNGDEVNAVTTFSDAVNAVAAGANPVTAAVQATASTANGMQTSTATSFAALKAQLDGGLTASVSNLNNTNTGRISLELIKIDAGSNDVATGIDGYYAILNNTNRILDSGDMMFRLSTDFAVATTTANGDGQLSTQAAVAGVTTILNPQFWATAAPVGGALGVISLQAGVQENGDRSAVAELTSMAGAIEAGF
jgi:hypothetical protein